MDQGPNFADWLSAWGQVGGAIATTLAVIVALWLPRRERHRAELAAFEASRRMAAMIVATPIESGFQVINYSAAPVRDVSVTATIDDRENAVFYQGHRPKVIRVLPPGGPNALIDGSWQQHHTADDGSYVGVALLSWPGADKTAYTIEFTDSDGLRWRRTRDERPELVVRDGVEQRTWSLGRMSLSWRTPTSGETDSD